jgi:hypothetical protein
MRPMVESNIFIAGLSELDYYFGGFLPPSDAHYTYAYLNNIELYY